MLTCTGAFQSSLLLVWSVSLISKEIKSKLLLRHNYSLMHDKFFICKFPVRTTIVQVEIIELIEHNLRI